MSNFVRVPLRDALSGSLPPVCCMTGERAAGFAPMVVPKRLGVAWLLLLAGPIGLLVLAMIWRRVRVHYVVRMPMSSAAFDRMHSMQVRRLWCGWLGAMGLVLAFAFRSLPGVGIAVFVASVAALGLSLRAHLRLPWTMPSMVADATGRWLELLGVHGTFIRAVEGRG